MCILLPAVGLFVRAGARLAPGLRPRLRQVADARVFVYCVNVRLLPVSGMRRRRKRNKKHVQTFTAPPVRLRRSSFPCTPCAAFIFIMRPPPVYRASSTSLYTLFILAGLQNYQYLLVADAYSLLHIVGFCLRFSSAPDGFAKGILLQCERLSFKRRKTVSCKLKGHHLKP